MAGATCVRWGMRPLYFFFIVWTVVANFSCRRNDALFLLRSQGKRRGKKEKMACPVLNV